MSEYAEYVIQNYLLINVSFICKIEQTTDVKPTIYK